MNQTFMKEKPVLPLVLSMSLPMVLSMLVTSLYNIVDSYFVAQISEDAMTALSLIYPLQLLVNAVAVGFGIGINATAAYHLGAGDSLRANDTVTVGLLLSCLHGLGLTLFCLAAAPWFLGLFTQDAAVLNYGLSYSTIVFAFALPNTLGISMEKIFQAEGQMVVSMSSMLAGCVANIVLDPLLIFGLGPFPTMGIQGAALATGLGQALTLAVYLIVYILKPLPLRLRPRREMLNRKLCYRIYAVGIPATLNMGLPSVLITALNGILASFSSTYVLVLGIYYKLQTFIYLSANGIVQGIRPIVGYNYGAGEYTRVDRVFRTALRLIAGVMLAGMVICLCAAETLMGLFTQNPETVQAGALALRIISLGFVVSALSVTVSGVLEGLGQGMLSLIISLMRNLLAVLAAAFLLSRFLGAAGVWHGFWSAELLTGAVSWVLYRRAVRKKLLHLEAAPRKDVCGRQR